MYSAADIVSRIKQQAKTQDVRLRDMLVACEMGINGLSQISDKKGLSSTSLARIADYLDCSVDYLLGRTDNPKSHISATAVEEEIAKADQVIKTAKYHLKSNLAELQVRRQLERKMALAKYLEGFEIVDRSDLFDGIEIVAIEKAAKKQEGKA